MITFIVIVGVLMRALPMVAVLLLIWHVSRKTTDVAPRHAGEAAYASQPEARFGGASKRYARRRRPLAATERPGRRARVLVSAGGTRPNAR